MAAGIQAVGCVRTEGLHSIPVEHGLEGSGTQAFDKGSLLIYSSGTLVVAGTNPSTVIGVALNDATGTAGTDIFYVPALQDSLIFEASVDGAVSVGAGPATGKPSDLTIGQVYGMTLDTVVNHWYIDTSKSGTTLIRIVDYDSDQANVVQGRARFRFERTSATLFI